MANFQGQVNSEPRTQADINAERNRQRQANGVAAFVDATNAPDGGAYGYELMLQHLFAVFESDHGNSATINTVLEALKPLILKCNDPARVNAIFASIIDEAYEKKETREG